MAEKKAPAQEPGDGGLTPEAEQGLKDIEQAAKDAEPGDREAEVEAKRKAFHKGD